MDSDEVGKTKKSRGGLGSTTLTSPSPSLLFFRALFYFAPLPLSERLEQANLRGRAGLYRGFTVFKPTNQPKI